MVRVSGNIHEDFAENVNNPSIFTKWTILLPKKENQDLDLSKKIQFHILFSGSLILSEYSFPTSNILDMHFLETGEIESSELSIEPFLNPTRSTFSLSLFFQKVIHEIERIV